MDGAVPPRFRGRAPPPDTGEPSPATVILRPPLRLPGKAVAEARAMRREGYEPKDIAAALGCALDDVERALLGMRTAHPGRGRGTLNVSVAAHRFVLAAQREGERVWETVDRLIDELIRRRAGAGAPRRGGNGHARPR